MCVLLIVPNSGDNVLAKSLAMLWWEADPMPEMIGLRGILGSWVWGKL